MAVQLKQSSTVILLEESHLVSLVSIDLVFQNSGALSASAGVANLAAKLLEEGTADQDAHSFADALESRAVSINAYTGAETFVISLSCMKSELEFAMQKLVELISAPSYSNSTFVKIKNQIIGRLTQRESDYDYLASSRLKELLFANTPASSHASGKLQDIDHITRADLKSYISTHLCKENLLVVAAGELNEQEIKAYTNTILELLPSQKPTILDPIITSNDAQVHTEHKEHIDQAYIYFGSPFEMKYDSPDSYLAKVAIFVLGSSGFGSRLMEEVRVRQGLAYSVYASLHQSRTTNYISGYLQTKFDNADKAISSVKEIIDRFIKTGITQDELDSAKKFLLGSEPLRYETLQHRLSIAFDEYYSGKGLGYKKKELLMIDSIELKVVNNFIKKHKEISKLSFAIVTK